MRTGLESAQKIHAARVRRARRADKPGASKYAKANVHGAMRPKKNTVGFR